MRKALILWFLVLALLLGGCAPAFTSVSANTLETEPAEPEVVPEYRDAWTKLLDGKTMTARYYFVYDCNTREFLLLSGDKEDAVFPASVTKLFSAYVALRYILPDEQLTAGSELALVPEDASVAGLQQGDTLTVAQLVEGMMLPSGNDATFVLATAVGRILAGDPELEPQAAMDRFVEEMNTQAAILGLTDTRFVTPDGWHSDGHYTSMDDLVKIGMLAWNHPVIARYVTVSRESIPMDEERTLEWDNTNLLLYPELDYYCPYAVGLKTGFTTPAGNCVLTAFRVGSRELLIGVFGCPNQNDRFSETLLLFCQTFGLEIPEYIPEDVPAVSQPDSSE